jgi:hypothetical protein
VKVCKHRLELLLDFSSHAGRMEKAIRDFMRASMESTRRPQLKRKYERLKLATRKSRERYFRHCQEHGC